MHFTLEYPNLNFVCNRNFTVDLWTKKINGNCGRHVVWTVNCDMQAVPALDI